MMIVWLSMGACSLRPIRVGDVPGTYKAVFGSADSTLMLNPDGSCNQSVSPKSGNAISLMCKWKFDEKNSQILLEPSIRIAYYQNPTRFDETVYTVRRRVLSGSIYIDGEDPDGGSYFNKER